jgi:hypothetical protein
MFRLSVGVRRNGLSSSWLATSYLTTFGLCLLSYAFTRSDIEHLTPTNLIALVVLCSCIGHGKRARPALLTALRWILIALALIALLIAGRLFASEARTTIVEAHSTGFMSLDLDRARGIRTRTEETAHMASAVKYIKDQVPAGSRIFVGNLRHDNILLSDVLFYFLSERHCAGRYHMLHPGVATTRRVQEEIIGELQKYGVEYIVLLNVVPNREPNRGSESGGATVLDRYLRSNYVQTRAFGPYIVARHKNSIRQQEVFGGMARPSAE